MSTTTWLIIGAVVGLAVYAESSRINLQKLGALTMIRKEECKAIGGVWGCPGGSAYNTMNPSMPCVPHCYDPRDLPA